MTDQCGSIPRWAELAVLITFLVFERWLGRTTKVKQGSTLDLIAAIVVAVLVALVDRMKRRKENTDGEGF